MAFIPIVYTIVSIISQCKWGGYLCNENGICKLQHFVRLHLKIFENSIIKYLKATQSCL